MEGLGSLMQKLMKVGYSFLLLNKLKPYIYLTWVVLLVAIATGCPLTTKNKPKLTTQQAQRALERWSDGSFKVLGIKEIPEQNSATADFTVEGRKYDIGTVYNGPGVAVFSFYTDGRIAMTQVILSEEIMGVYKTNVAVVE